MDNTFDKMYYEEGALIAGVDESGVSDIAGPLVAACVILPKIDVHKDDLKIFEIDDSKNIPEKYRKRHAEVIWQTAIGIGIGEVQPVEIDYLGALASTRLAMFRSVLACRTPTKGKSLLPDCLLVDHVKHLQLPLSLKQIHIEGGDGKSLAIAAASIVAKVYRDEVMLQLHEKFPWYDWASNKGYPCNAHFSGIDEHGVIIGVHRIKKWPFTRNPSLQEDFAKWQKRRKLWKKKTAYQIEQELASPIWTQRPQKLRSVLWSSSTASLEDQNTCPEL